MPSKMTIFFNEYGSGFSETFYHDNNDPANLASVVPNSLYQAAVGFRHIGVLVKAVRFSRVNGPRRSLLVRPYPIAQGRRITGQDIGPDVASTTAVYALSSTSGAKRNVWCRGLSDVDIRRDEFGNDIETAWLFGLRNVYFQALNTAGFRIQAITRPPDAGLVWRRIFLVFGTDPTSVNRAWITPSVAAPEFNVGDVFSVSGVPSTLPRFPRKIEILNKQTIAGVVSYLIAYALPGNVTVNPKRLRITPYTNNYEIISLWEFVRFGAHKTGRPFGSLRGRARVAASLQ